MANQTQLAGQLPFVAKNSDLFMAVAVVGILVFMVMPLPTLLLDLLLSFSITFSLIILLASMYVQQPLELSSFPSILLLVTLFRLALNVASTRIILLHGNEGTLAAGKVIKAFGGFVVGGNYLVGIIVFLILVAINFLVITKGAGRIAEVAARFTLDAMPMAVAVVGILVFMVMPLPTLLLDLLLSFSITFSLVILLASMYVQKPLELSAFPSILLLVTLFRLALNVASTLHCRAAK